MPEVVVLIPEVEPRKWRPQVPHNQHDVILAEVLRRCTDVIVARLPFHVAED